MVVNGLVVVLLLLVLELVVVVVVVWVVVLAVIGIGSNVGKSNTGDNGVIGDTGKKLIDIVFEPCGLTNVGVLRVFKLVELFVDVEAIDRLEDNDSFSDFILILGVSSEPLAWLNVSDDDDDVVVDVAVVVVIIGAAGVCDVCCCCCCMILCNSDERLLW